MQQWVARLRTLSKQSLLPVSHSVQFLLLNMDCIEALRADACAQSPIEDELRTFLEDCQPNDHRCIFTLQRHLKAHQRVLEQAIVAQRKQRQAERVEYYEDDPHSRKAFRSIRGKGTPPLLFTKRTSPGPNGEAIGTITSNPADVDREVQHAYSRYYQGNVAGSLVAHAVQFFPNMISIFFVARFSPSSLCLGRIF